MEADPGHGASCADGALMECPQSCASALSEVFSVIGGRKSAGVDCCGTSLRGIRPPVRLDSLRELGQSRRRVYTSQQNYYVKGDTASFEINQRGRASIERKTERVGEGILDVKLQ